MAHRPFSKFHLLIFFITSCAHFNNCFAGAYAPKLMLNEGAVCYANTGIQCLFATRSFPQWLKKQTIDETTKEKFDQIIQYSKVAYDFGVRKNKIKTSILTNKYNPQNQNEANAMSLAIKAEKIHAKLAKERLELRIERDNYKPNQKRLNDIEKRLTNIEKEQHKQQDNIEGECRKIKDYDSLASQMDKAIQHVQKLLTPFKPAPKNMVNPKHIITALQQLADQYFSPTTPFANPICLGTTLGNNTKDQLDASEETINILNLLKRISNFPIESIMATDFDIEPKENKPILFVEIPQATPILLQITPGKITYNLVSTAWRTNIPGSPVGHYFAITKYQKEWYRLDEPETYGNQYDNYRLPELNTLKIDQKKFMGEMLIAGQANLMAGEFGLYENSITTVRIAVYERDDIEQYLKELKSLPVLPDALQKLQQDLTALGALIK